MGPLERVGAAHVVYESLAGLRWSNLLAKLKQVQMFACTIPIASHSGV
jgi:hypothetical protein